MRKKGQISGQIFIYILSLVVVSLIATASMSGMFGLLLGSVLVVMFGHTEFKVKYLLYSLLYIIVVVLLVSIAVQYIDRLNLYWQYLDVVIGLVDNPYQRPPTQVFVLYNNIYPVIKLYNQVLEWNLWQFVFGSGLGSSGFANSELGLWDTFVNPNSQITRIIYEYGLMGAVLFIASIRMMTLSFTKNWLASDRKIIVVLMMVLVGCYLAHRSTVLMICLGMLYLFVRVNSKRKDYIGDT